MEKKDMKNLVLLLIGFVLSIIASVLLLLEIQFTILVVLLIILATLVFIYAGLTKRPQKARNVSLIDGINYDLKKAVNAAEHSVFISGATLSSLLPYRDLFRSLAPKIKLELILLDNDNEELIRDYCTMVNGELNKPKKLRTQYESFLILVEELQKRGNTTIKCVDFIMPIVYVGIDIDARSSSSKIKSQHYIRYVHGGEGSIGFEVNANTELFRIYKKQIDLLREGANKHLLV